MPLLSRLLLPLLLLFPLLRRPLLLNLFLQLHLHLDLLLSLLVRDALGVVRGHRGLRGRVERADSFTGDGRLVRGRHRLLRLLELLECWVACLAGACHGLAHLLLLSYG